jgi:hypothetical protein
MATISAPFTVEFGKTGRTVEYRDPTGCLIFTFDVSDDHSLILEHHDGRSPRPLNYDEAFARSKQFLASRGYKVEDFGVAVLPDPLTEKEAAGLIRGQIHQPPPSSISLVYPHRRAKFKDDADNSKWNLWLVGELEVGPHRGHKVVFDERTKQFGVASPDDVFLGFWGSFDQTVEALLTT